MGFVSPMNNLPTLMEWIQPYSNLNNITDRKGVSNETYIVLQGIFLFHLVSIYFTVNEFGEGPLKDHIYS